MVRRLLLARRQRSSSSVSVELRCDCQSIGHRERVSAVRWCPTTASVVASASWVLHCFLFAKTVQFTVCSSPYSEKCGSCARRMEAFACGIRDRRNRLRQLRCRPRSAVPLRFRGLRAATLLSLVCLCAAYCSISLNGEFFLCVCVRPCVCVCVCEGTETGQIRVFDIKKPDAPTLQRARLSHFLSSDEMFRSYYSTRE